LYCPKCGREMEYCDGQLACKQGQMGLSPSMHSRLTTRFPKHRTRPPQVEVGARLLRWYCPSCGIPLGDDLKCSSCGGDIKDLHYQLVELHPHREEESQDSLQQHLIPPSFREIVPPGTVWSAADVERVIAQACVEAMDWARKQGLLDEVLRRGKPSEGSK
jgi:hypothetical protein